MKKIRLVFFPALFCLLTASCFSPAPEDETLLLFARSQDVYREGHFAEAARMLSGEARFIPALVLRGKAEYLSGNLAASEKSLRRALKLKPGDTEASLFLARLLREKGEAGEARNITEKLLGNHPYDIRALRFAAELAREKGASGEAASAALLDRAVEASAESALVFFDRARLRWSGGNAAGAREDLDRARALLSRDSPVFKAAEKLAAVISEVSP